MHILHMSSMSMINLALHDLTVTTLNSQISVGHTNFLLKVELTWVQDLGSSPNSLFF